MTCKGICIRYKASGRYATGRKRCQQCDLFIEWDGLRCPCCGYKLRTRPRNFSKTKLREKRAIDELKRNKDIFSFIVCEEKV
jgi:hypothetical protein